MKILDVIIDDELLFDIVRIIAPHDGENSNVWIHRARRELDQAMRLMQQETVQGKTNYASSIHVMSKFYDVLNSSGLVINCAAEMIV